MARLLRLGVVALVRHLFQLRLDLVDVAPELVEDLEDDVAVAQVVAAGLAGPHGKVRGAFRRKVAREHFGRDGPVGFQDGDAVGHALQLADVAGPAVGAEQLLRLGRQPDGRDHVLVGEIQGELAEQQVDVALALAQGRHGDRNRAEPVIEVFAELAVADGVQEVDVGGGHHAHVGLLHLGRTDLDELASLQDAEQADLGGERKLRHFVEEERTAVSFFEIALARLDGAGEGALLVTEKFGIDGTFGDAAAVQGEVGFMFSRAVLVDDLRNDLLAHAALARDQHGQVRGGNLTGDFESPVELGVVSDDAEALLDLIQIHICKVRKKSIHLYDNPPRKTYQQYFTNKDVFMKKLVSNLLLIAVIAFGMASCTNAQKMIDAADQINIQCNPEVLEVIAGNIDATVSVTFPPEYFLPKATLEVTPVLLYVGGEAVGKPFFCPA